MRSGNPVLNQEVFTQYPSHASSEVMTTQGTSLKTALLLLVCLLTAGYSWTQFFQGNTSTTSGLMMVGAFGGFILALVTTFKPTWSPITSPIYAALQGLFLGGISAVMEAQYGGLVIQAILCTFSVLAVMLMMYMNGWIRVTESFRFGVVAATGGIALIYIAALVLSFFGIQIPFLFGNGLFGILFSFFVVGVASLNLVLDFDLIDRATARGAPKYMEWYGAFALMVTLVWLYIEVLRLLSKLRSR